MKKVKHISLCLLWCAIICSELVFNAHSQSYSKRRSIFLTEEEKTRLQKISSTSPTAALLSAMQARVQKRAASVSFSDPSTTNQWWHHAGEYLTDAALIHAVRPSEGSRCMVTRFHTYFNTSSGCRLVRPSIQKL